jgi:hypothetical protein
VILDATGADDPAQRLAEIIARPASAESALAVQARLHHAAGLEPPDPARATPEEAAREEPSVRPRPNRPSVVRPTLEERIRATRQRLDQLQQRAAEPKADRSLGL